MAEIKIEKKKSLWPWLIIGLVLVAILIYFLTSNEKVAELTVPTTAIALVNVHENNPTVADYVNYVEADTLSMSLDHKYTHDALVKLSDASKAIAGVAGFAVEVDLDRVKDYAQMITEKPLVNVHADSIRKATDLVSAFLQSLQQAKYPELAFEAAELKKASAAISPDVLTLDQKGAVKTFFRIAADLLKKMN